jgi:hypothetical protein
MQGRTATLASKTAISTTWSMTTGLDYTPKSFIVTLKTDDGTYYVSEVLAAVVSSGTALQALNVTNAGIRISNPNEFAVLGDNSKKDKDFALSSDIDLADSGAWDGPDGYSGHFYGNGYTIKNLVLAGTASEVGLFKSLGDGADLQDFTVEVSTANPDATYNGILFGGISGKGGPGNKTLQNITVRGSLVFGDISGATNVGGFIGSTTGQNLAADEILIDRCVSELDITLKNGTSAQEASVAFGGFTGCIVGRKVIITNSYSTGSLRVKNNGNRLLVAGSITGDIKDNGVAEIINCYASGSVIVENQTSSGNRSLSAGGIIGIIGGRRTGYNGDTRNPTSVKVENCAAVNASVITISGGTGLVRDNNGRLCGKNEATAGTYTFTNNFAWLEMPVGIVANEALAAAANETGAGNNLNNGEGIALTTLHDKTIWVNHGFTEDIWDFSNIATDWPTLK